LFCTFYNFLLILSIKTILNSNNLNRSNWSKLQNIFTANLERFTTAYLFLCY